MIINYFIKSVRGGGGEGWEFGEGFDETSRIFCGHVNFPEMKGE